MDSSSAESWLDTAVTIDTQQDPSVLHFQSETMKPGKVVSPVDLFRQFVSAVSFDSLSDIKSQPEFLTSVRDLCVKAPSVAQHLTQEILSHQRDDSLPIFQLSKEVSRKKPLDPSYRPPKPFRAQLVVARPQFKDLHGVLSSSSRDGDDSIIFESGGGNMNTNDLTEKLFPRDEEYMPKIIAAVIPQGEVQCQSAAYSHTLPSISGKLALAQLKYTRESTKGKTVPQEPLAVLDEPTKDGQTIPGPLLQSEAEQDGEALAEVDSKAPGTQALSPPSLIHRTEPHETTSPGPTPSTPVRNIDRGCQSPLSEDQTATPQTVLFTPTINREVLSPLTEVDRTASPPEKAEIALPEGIPLLPNSTGQQLISLGSATLSPTQQVEEEQSISTQDSQTMLPSSLLGKALTIADMVAKSVHIIYQISRRQELPKEVHSRILSTLQSGLRETPASTIVAECADSMQATWSASMWIGMLEAGHARSREVTILNMIECMGASKWYDTQLEQAKNAPPLTKRGGVRKRLATIVLDKYLEEDLTVKDCPEKVALKDNEDHPLSPDSAGINKNILTAKRKRLNNLFHRGRALRKLVETTHLGILFDPDIWSYIKASKENTNTIAMFFQADQQKMELLSILDEQVQLLAKKGRPDISLFFDSLESHFIIPSVEVSSLRAKYGGEKEPVPQGGLESAIDQVNKEIQQVLGKNPCDNDASIIVDGVELSCGMLDRLRSRKWLNCWDIHAALEMVDRPVCVELGLSIPLHKEDADGIITATTNPLRSWKTKIDNYRSKVENDLRGKQVYFCPLNLNQNHFTLLEINEQKKTIYHYDSMVGPKINCKENSTLVRLIVEEEFKYLAFRYIEVPTPQQRDGWSCGLMVIRNARRRMVGLAVGSRDEEVNLDWVIKEVVENCQTFLEANPRQPSLVSKKRKKRVDGPPRSSKRLKDRE